MYLTLKTDSVVVFTREPDPDSEWDAGCRETNWSVKGVSISDKESWALPIDFEVSVGDEIFVVYAIYSTGDSFGVYNKSSLEVFDFFKTEEKADALALILQNAGDDDSPRGPFEYTTESGKTARVAVPWGGYFESLDQVYVEGYKVDAK